MDCSRSVNGFVRAVAAVLLALVSLSSLLVAPRPTLAQSTLTVTNGSDSGAGSLRAAIAAASPNDTIIFNSNVTTVTLTSGQLVISSTLTIDGGTNGVTVERSGTAPPFRIFNITAGTVNLNSLTISGGQTLNGADGASSNDGGNGGDGGGILNAGTLTIRNSTINNNATGAGGRAGDASAISGKGGNGGGIANTGTLTVVDSTISNNTVGNGGNARDDAFVGGFGGLGGDGGGIYNTGTLTVRGSTLSNNRAGNGGLGGNGLDSDVGDGGSGSDGGAGGSGGGIFNLGPGTVTVTSSTLMGNLAGSGGNSGNGGNSTFDTGNGGFGGPISSNFGGSGGGISNTNGQVTVIDSTLMSNQAGNSGNGGNGGNGGPNGFGGEGGGGFGTSFSGKGGGIFSAGNAAILTVTSSTLTSNQGGTGGLGGTGGTGGTNGSPGANDLGGDGGGIAVGDSPTSAGIVRVTSSTLTGNQLGGATAPTSPGGGIAKLDSAGTVTLANSIVANSTDSTGAPVNDYTNAANITALGNNIIERSSNINNQGGGTITPGDPNIGPLANNGGPTLTHLPLTTPSAPAVNTGSNAALAENTLGYDFNGNGNTNDTLTTDQRGFPRVAGGTVDIGAVELNAGNIDYGVSVVPTSVIEGNGGAPISATVTVTRSGVISATSSLSVTLGGTATQGTDYTFALTSSGASFDAQTGVLTFNAGIAQATFTVAVQGDTQIESDETVVVTLANPTPPDGGTISTPSATLTITNDDTSGADVRFTESGGSTSVAEGGATDTYDVVLASQPTATVTISITTGAQLRTTPTTLTFTTVDWNTPQTVTVSAVDDTVVEGAHTGTISHSASSSDSNYNSLIILPLSVTIQDNDGANVLISKSGGSVAEGGATDTYDVVLTSQPTATVTISITTGAQLRTTPTTLTFTTVDWNTPQTVTVSAVDDTVVEGAHTGTISHSASSSDSNYNSLIILPLSVTIQDNDSGSSVVYLPVIRR